MHRIVVLVLVAVVVACSSATSPPASSPDGGDEDDPCGTNAYADLPDCTPARENLTCSREACFCCPDQFTCEAGSWVVTGVAGGTFNCPDGG